MRKLLLSVLIMSSSYICANYMFTLNNPRGQTYVMRLAAANDMTFKQPNYNISSERNGDEQDVPDYAAGFHKALEHDATTGLLTARGKASYQQLLAATDNGLQNSFNAIVRASGATRKLVSPQAAYTRSFMGVPSCIIPMLPAPKLSSAEAAAEIMELYLMMICRDVEFKDYGTGTGTDVDTVNNGSITNNAAAILTSLGSAYKGPLHNGIVTAQELFRSASAGDLTGPYISQFWWLPLHFHYMPVEHKQYVASAQQREFGVAWADFIAIQNGSIPKPYDYEHDFLGEHYIIKGRNVGTVVHDDAPGDYFVDAANILLYNKAPLSPNLPYYNGSMTNEAAFVNMNIVDIYSAVMDVAQEALMHAWAHKWRASRNLRPETRAGHVHRAKITNSNPLHLDSSLFTLHAGIDLLAWVKAHNELQASLSHNSIPLADAQTYLLGQMFPEGSPIHPAYPSGHATIAGACSTVMKAFFKDTALLYQTIVPVKPDPSDPSELIPLPDNEGAQLLTIGGELDKLASNIANGRNFAGVHYRSDGDDGIALGEELAIRYLQDRCCRYTEQGFAGFELTKRNGVRIRITAKEVKVIS